MDIFALVTEWTNLLVRWFHITLGITWIGASIYFVWLDLALRQRDKMNKGVGGTAWMVHGGGFYHVEKYTVAPDHLPEDLHWFRWEAYLTWLSGIALLILQYYINAKSYLIDPTVMPLEPWQAISISIVSLVVGWLIYDGLCRSKLGQNTPLLAVSVLIFLMVATWGYDQVFSGRGALIHVGALIGTIMAANVFAVIMPGQTKATNALLAGDVPDPKYGLVAKQRSVHNNYLTLPVLLMMVSSHYPLLVSSELKWLIVGLVIIVGASVRHHINSHDAEKTKASYWWSLPVGGLALILAIIASAYRPSLQAVNETVSDARAMEIIGKHCVTCHAANPKYDGFDAPPAEVSLETIEQLDRHAAKIKAQAVTGNAMPLGNETGMTDLERSQLGAWIDARQ